jgi:hypothetical protein
VDGEQREQQLRRPLIRAAAALLLIVDDYCWARYCARYYLRRRYCDYFRLLAEHYLCDCFHTGLPTLIHGARAAGVLIVNTLIWRHSTLLAHVKGWWASTGLGKSPPEPPPSITYSI